MPIKTKRWNEPKEPGDGFRLLICRYWPRGLAKADSVWEDWQRNLGPSPELHRAWYPKPGCNKISWEDYCRRYRQEMIGQQDTINTLARRAQAGETITLLCSKACVDETRCHRTLLKNFIEAAMKQL